MRSPALLALATLLGTLQDLDSVPGAPRARSVAILVYDGAELLDFAGPAEVLSHAGRMVRVEGRPALDVFTVAPARRSIRTQNGVSIAPDLALSECLRADVLVVPGGANDALMNDPDAMRELGRIAAGAEIRMSVCTGAYVLGALGLLDGREVTTHSGVIDGLRRRHPEARVVGGMRFVDAGSVITCAGVSAGIDGALHLVARLLGEDLARHTAEFMEYPWGPAAGSARVEHDGHAVDPSLTRAERLYLGAIEQVQEGGLEEAVRWLRGALEAGLEAPERILADPALAALRDDERGRRGLAELLVGAGVVDGAATRPREPIVGLPCEGCEAVFDGLPPVLGSRSRIAPPDEPGERLTVEGTVRDAQGRPAPGVVVYAYHTDARGVYPPGAGELGAAARRHGRLRGWVATDERGRYRFDTIRPGSYPQGGTPAHVHMHVIEVGRCTYYVDDVHFADDPLLSAEEREELAAGRGGSGLVQPRRDAEGTWTVTRDIRLGEGVPGYPREEAAASGDGPRPADPRDPDPTFLVTEPEWSRDGARIAFAGGVWPDLDVYVLDVADGEALRVFQSEATDYMPSWSPDGERLVFASTRAGSHDLYVGSLDGGAVVRITADEGSDETEPRWSPDGAWIAFRSDRDGSRDVHRVRPDGSDRRRLTEHEAEDGEPSWSPDGRRLVFTSYRDGQPEVYVMAADGADPVRLTHTPGGHSRRAEWSPDGAWIAFGSNRGGDEDVYVMRADGSGVRGVGRHPAREYYSRWSPDGRSLLFTSNRERERNALYTTSLDGATVERLFPADR